MSLTLDTFTERWIQNKTKSLSFFKDESVVVELCEDIKELNIESCFELVNSRIDYHEYILDIIQIFCFYKLGRIKDFKYRINNLANRLLELKKYNRILELKKISKLFDARDESFNKIIETVKLRLGHSESISTNIDFMDVVNNSNIYFRNNKTIDIFFSLTEVFNFNVFIKAIFTGVKQLYESEKILNCVIEIIKSSKNIKLIEVLNIHYKNEVVEVLSHPVSKVEEYKFDTSLEYKIRNEDHLSQLCKIREVINNDNLSREEYIILLKRMISKYEILGMLEKSKKLTEHLKQFEILRGEIPLE